MTLVGATTENPYFEVNSALLSRCRVYELGALGPEHVLELMQRALSDPRGIPTRLRSPPRPCASWPRARAATRARRWPPWSWPPRTAQRRGGGPGGAEDAMQRKAVLYDKGGDRHYDTISAWIKATRGSDPDASLLYLAMMLEGGEDPRFIARRMVILASEDVGNADPRALSVAVAAAHAVEHVGLPECAHNLAQAAVYLALAPKSNASYRALAAAREYVREHGPLEPPAHLRSAAYPGARALGRGGGYEDPHDLPERLSAQEHMPAGAEDARFLELSDQGEERALGERLDGIRARRGRDSGG